MTTANPVPITDEEFFAWLNSPDKFPRSFTRVPDPLSSVRTTSSPAQWALATPPAARISASPTSTPSREQVELLSLQNTNLRLQNENLALQNENL